MAGHLYIKNSLLPPKMIFLRTEEMLQGEQKIEPQT